MADLVRKNAVVFSMETTTEAEGKKTMTAECPKKAAYKKTILLMVRHAEEKFSMGLRYGALSQKMLKTIRSGGYDLPTLLEEMNDAGEIFLYTDADFSRLVMTAEMREYYKLGIIGEETPETKNFINAKWGRRPKRREQ